MKVFVMDTDDEGMGVNFAWRCRNAGHSVRYWRPGILSGNHGKGMFTRVTEWRPSMDWADLIVLTGNSEVNDEQSLMEDLSTYFGKGYPIFGANQKSAELELDRGVGQRVLEDHGIRTLPYEVIDSPDEAVRFLLSEGEPYVMKPWGGHADKALTSVPGDLDEALFTIRRWEAAGLWPAGTQIMMQQKVKGIEMGIAGWFGPGGWSKVVEESFEHKKFLAGDLGENTGEMGTVIRHVDKSRLFDELLDPITDYLHVCNYVGDVSVNTIIDAKGRPFPLEFTMRLGWPDFNIRQAVIAGDPAEWMRDLLQGRDTFKVRDEIAVGLVITHGDFPKCRDKCAEWEGYPLSGIDMETWHPQQVMMNKAVGVVDGKEVNLETHCTTGQYICVVTGTGKTVNAAATRATKNARELTLPSNRMFRVDIGKRLEEELPLLHKFGYAKGMIYG